MPLRDYTRHFSTNFHLAYPVMLSQFGQVMVGVADSVMVGNLGAEPLAAASLANVIFHLLLTFGLGISYAITPLVAAADGDDQKDQIAAILKHGTVINVAASILITVFILSTSWGLRHLNQPVDVVELAIPYLGIITLSIIPFMIFQSARQFAEGLANTKQAMYVTISCNLINIGLNYVLIFGKLGFPPFGLVGAGLATLISRIMMAILMWIYIQKATRFRSFTKGFRKVKIQATLIHRMLKIGLPAGLQFVFEVGAFGMSTIMIGWIGTNALAAHQIAINMASLSYMTASGLSAAATIRVGNQFGRRDIKTLRDVAFSIFIMSGLFMLSAALIFVIGHNFFPTLYINDLDVIGIASALIIIAALFQLSDGIQVVGLGALRGLEDVKVPTVITFIAYWVIGLPVGYILGFRFDLGVEGVWYGFVTGLSLAALMLVIRFEVLTKRLKSSK